MKKKFRIIAVLAALCMLLCSCTPITVETNDITLTPTSPIVNSDSVSEIPEYDGEPYITINDNVPYFTESDYTTEAFEKYGELDSFGRCTTAFANVCIDIMPTEKRGAIGSVKPTGWQTAKYNSIDGKYLYNRCHLIGYQLSAENANKQNLITGTRYLNVTGMLPFEDKVADYVKQTSNHVLYRVTPVFEGTNLLASGVEMEAYSVEDDGKGVCFNVYCYNVQPGISIDYATGLSSAGNVEDEFDDGSDVEKFIVNIKSKKFHKEDCKALESTKEENKKTYTGSRSSLINNGYEPCKQCNP